MVARPTPFILIRKNKFLPRWHWVCVLCSYGGSTHHGSTKSFDHTQSNVRRHLRVRYGHHKWLISNKEHLCLAIEEWFEKERNGS